MIDFKRVLYILLLMLIVGLTMIYLRTLHFQAENQRVANVSQMRQLRQEIQRNHLDISYAIGSPEKLKEMLENANIQFPDTNDTIDNP